jgi:hypothetical protein
MPANMVKPGEEGAWERAKRTVEAEYEDVDVGSDRYYKLVTTLFENMKALAPPTPVHKATRYVVRPHAARYVVRRR